MNRFDLLFSYWIVAWYFFYMIGLITYNPTFALIIAILENILMLISMYKTRTSTVVFFIVALLLFKIVPLFSITRSIQPRDVFATLLLFMIYVSWLYLNGLTLQYPLQLSIDIIENHRELPFTFWMKKILKIRLNE
jgi:hypothetical protein